MPAFTSTSKHFIAIALGLLLLGCAGLLVGGSASARAAEGAASPGNSGGGKTFMPEEDDFTGSPFTEYGEFNEDKEEEEDAKFLQHGRFFGVSGGLGFEGVSGNRGVLWQGGFPLIDFKLHYWFDFNFALDMGFFFASHFYQTSDKNGGHVDVNMIHLALDAKYYFETKNLSSAISFANPFILVGFGSFTKTENSFLKQATDPDTGLGVSVGGGLEFAIRPKKLYFQVDGKYHMVSFKDTNSTDFKTSNSVDDLTGGFFTITGSILFTW